MSEINIKIDKSTAKILLQKRLNLCSNEQLYKMEISTTVFIIHRYSEIFAAK